MSLQTYGLQGPQATMAYLRNTTGEEKKFLFDRQPPLVIPAGQRVLVPAWVVTHILGDPEKLNPDNDPYERDAEERRLKSRWGFQDTPESPVEMTNTGIEIEEFKANPEPEIQIPEPPKSEVKSEEPEEPEFPSVPDEDEGETEEE